MPETISKNGANPKSQMSRNLFKRIGEIFMGLFSGLFKSKTSIDKEAKKVDKQLRQLKGKIEKDKKLLSTLEHERHADGTSYTKQDCG